MAKTKPLHMTRMPSFYLAWSADRILQTLSAKSSALPFRRTVPADLTEIAQTSSAQSSPARIDRTASDESQGDSIVQTTSGQGSYLAALAARSFYETEALRCGWSMRQLERSRRELEVRLMVRPKIEGDM